jgi:hypothetical protein
MVSSVSDLKTNFSWIASHFDALEWWFHTGKRVYPLIYPPVACAILSLPESNGHQERVFSSSTWMDGKLQRRQNPATHEMKALLYQNRGLINARKTRMDLSGKRSTLKKDTAQSVQKVIEMHIKNAEKEKKKRKETISKAKEYFESQPQPALEDDKEAEDDVYEDAVQDEEEDYIECLDEDEALLNASDNASVDSAPAPRAAASATDDNNE